MKYTFAVLLIFVFALGNVQDVQAGIQVGHRIEIVNVNDVAGDCGQTPSRPVPGNGAFLIFNIELDYSLSPTDLTQDRLVGLVFDANNNLIGRTFLLDRSRNLEDALINPDPIVPLYNELIRVPDSRPWRISTVFYPNSNSGPPPLSEILSYTTSKTYTFDPALYAPSCASLPYISNGVETNPLNEGVSVNDVAVYNATDDNGDPTLHIYDIYDEGEGTLALEITQDIIAPYIDNPPAGKHPNFDQRRWQSDALYSRYGRIADQQWT